MSGAVREGKEIMSFSGKFEAIADEGFYQTIEPDAARRQFNMSLGLVTLLALVALVVGISAGFAPLSRTAPNNLQAKLVVQQPQRVHVMQAEGPGQIPGG